MKSEERPTQCRVQWAGQAARRPKITWHLLIELDLKSFLFCFHVTYSSIHTRTYMVNAISFSYFYSHFFKFVKVWIKFFASPGQNFILKSPSYHN